MADRSIAQTISDSAQIISDSNRIGVDYLITDVRLALTLLALADTTHVASHRSRRIDEAFRAYTTVLHLHARLSPTPEQVEELRRELATLKDRLQLAGVSLRSGSDA